LSLHDVLIGLERCCIYWEGPLVQAIGSLLNLYSSGCAAEFAALGLGGWLEGRGGYLNEELIIDCKVGGSRNGELVADLLLAYWENGDLWYFNENWSFA